MMAEHLGEALLTVRLLTALSHTLIIPRSRPPCTIPRLPPAQYEELEATGRATLLSPFDLKLRVLVKGKVKLQKEARRSRRSARIARS